ncbi:hypothetical protein OCA90_00745 [Bacillus cereus]|nr:hypothetical protein [Bacillus cereus]
MSFFKKNKGIFDQLIKPPTRVPIQQTHMEPIKSFLDITSSGTDSELLNILEQKYDETPSMGAVLYCKLGFGIMEHSGIYVGHNNVMQLDGKGNINNVKFEEFTSNITTHVSTIWFPCDKETGQAISCIDAVDRAYEMFTKKRDYHLLLNNCHQFSSGCLTGDFENADNFLWMLKETLNKKHGKRIEWREWEWKKYI